MKKLLILMLVLGVASMANATLQISVGADQDPLDTEYTVLPSETIMLDIWTDADIGAFENVTWALVTADDEATITTGLGLIAGYTVMGNVQDMSWGPEGINGRFGGYFAGMSGNPTAGATLYDEFTFHCVNDEKDAVIELWQLQDLGGDQWGFETLLDSAVIHQIPEPMTMVLLGLGGLLLRRRK